MKEKTYIGCKIVKATPMTRKEACKKRLIRENDCKDRENEDGYKVVYENGYTSWSPKDVFDEHYVEVDKKKSKSILESVLNLLKNI